MHRTPGVGIFLLDDLSFTTPAAWTQFFQQTRTMPEAAIFLEVQQVSLNGEHGNGFAIVCSIERAVQAVQQPAWFHPTLGGAWCCPAVKAQVRLWANWQLAGIPAEV